VREGKPGCKYHFALYRGLTQGERVNKESGRGGFMNISKFRYAKTSRDVKKEGGTSRGMENIKGPNFFGGGESLKKPKGGGQNIGGGPKWKGKKRGSWRLAERAMRGLPRKGRRSLDRGRCNHREETDAEDS